MVDGPAARQHVAERAGFCAGRDAGESHAPLPVALGVSEYRLVEAQSRVVRGSLTAHPREPGPVAIDKLLGLVPRDFLDALPAVARDRDGPRELIVRPLGLQVVPLGGEARRGIMFDYQLDRHCSKTGAADNCRRLQFDYQLDRHCSKTIGTNSPLREGRPIQPN